MVTHGGHRMSVPMTNCGRVGCTTDRRGYRYDPLDQDSGATWPAMPSAFRFFSGTGGHTRSLCDWSSDVCSSDLRTPLATLLGFIETLRGPGSRLASVARRTRRGLDEGEQRGERGAQFVTRIGDEIGTHLLAPFRSEERRVGKEGRSRWSPYH